MSASEVADVPAPMTARLERDSAPEIPPPQLQPVRVALSALSPRTTQRGVMITVELRGTGLQPQHQARVLRGRQDASGIHVTRQAFVDATRARVTLLVDEDAPIGIYSLALVDPDGRFSNSLSLEVIL